MTMPDYNRAKLRMTRMVLREIKQDFTLGEFKTEFSILEAKLGVDVRTPKNRRTGGRHFLDYSDRINRVLSRYCEKTGRAQWSVAPEKWVL